VIRGCEIKNEKIRRVQIKTEKTYLDEEQGR